MFRLPVRTGAFQRDGGARGVRHDHQDRSSCSSASRRSSTCSWRPRRSQESVTVSADAPLIDRTSSTVGSNVDPRQMQELPLNGRNFVDLTMLAPGSRQNASTDELGAASGTFQLNVDGLRVTQNQTGGFGQPKYSRDAIAEFEFVANRFDATQGGSTRHAGQRRSPSPARTRSSGTFSGYFRDDPFIAEGLRRRTASCPYSDTQLSWTFGGPILKDRLHFFGNYEHEREPQTFSHSSPWPSFNFDH